MTHDPHEPLEPPAVDLGVLNPGRDAERWSRAIQRVVATAQARRRPSLARELVRLSRYALPVVAAAIALWLLPGRDRSTGASAPAAAAQPGWATLTAWASGGDGAPPNPLRLLDYGVSDVR